MVEAGLLLLPVVVVITGAVAAVVADPQALVAAKAAAMGAVDLASSWVAAARVAVTAAARRTLRPDLRLCTLEGAARVAGDLQRRRCGDSREVAADVPSGRQRCGRFKVAVAAAANARLAHSRAVVGTRGSRNWRVAKLALLAAMASRGSRVRSRALSMAVVTGTASRIRPSFASRVAASNGNRRA